MRKRQRVILETEDGSCIDEEMLKRVWEMRLNGDDYIDGIAPHYKIVRVEFLPQQEMIKMCEEEIKCCSDCKHGQVGSREYPCVDCSNMNRTDLFEPCRFTPVGR